MITRVLTSKLQLQLFTRTPYLRLFNPSYHISIMRQVYQFHLKLARPLIF